MNIAAMKFDDWVKRAKAIVWLLEHDPLIQAFVEDARKSPSLAIEIAAWQGVLISEKINALMPKMVVTQDDRKFGYQMPEQFRFWPVDVSSTGTKPV